MSKKLLSVLMSFGLILNVNAVVKDAPREEYVGSTVNTVTDAYTNLTLEEANQKKLELEKDDHDSKVTVKIKPYVTDSGRDEVISITKHFSSKEEMDKFVADLEKQGYKLDVDVKQRATVVRHSINEKFDTLSEAEKAKKDFENTYSDAVVTISKVRNANKDSLSFEEGTTKYETLEEAEEVARNLTVDNDEKRVEATVRTVKGTTEVSKDTINKTFDTEKEADDYINSLIKQGYDTSKITKKMLSKEEFTWDDGVEVNPGNPSGTFTYPHFDISLTSKFYYVDENGKTTTTHGSINISTVKINGSRVKMGNKTWDGNRGDFEYASVDRNLTVTNKSLVEITGYVTYNGKQLPFTVKGYLSEKQNVCKGKGYQKGFDLEFESVTIVKDKVLVDTKLITKYQVTGEITKTIEQNEYYVDVNTVVKGYDYEVKGEGNRFNYIDEYDVEGTASKDIMETRANLDVTTETKLYERYGKVITRYVDTKGNEIKESVSTIDKVGAEYETSYPESIGKYDFVYVDKESDEVSGVYEYSVKTVTYVYEYVGGIGGDDPEFPRTGVTSTYYLELIFIVSLLALITVVKIKNN